MQGFTYAVDLVLVIDATGSMSSIIDRVKSNALEFHDSLQKIMTEKGKEISELRARVVVSRDLYVDGDSALDASPFFVLPDEEAAFSDFVSGIRATGGGDEPETTLEALAVAMRSPWSTEGTRRRQIIVVWTDASTHPLDRAVAKPAGYPSGMPADFDGLTDMWEGQEHMDSSAKRLILYAPDSYAWTDIATHWQSSVHYTSKAGSGLSDVDFTAILDAIAQSV